MDFNTDCKLPFVHTTERRFRAAISMFVTVLALSGLLFELLANGCWLRWLCCSEVYCMSCPTWCSRSCEDRARAADFANERSRTGLKRAQYMHGWDNVHNCNSMWSCSLSEVSHLRSPTSVMFWEFIGTSSEITITQIDRAEKRYAKEMHRIVISLCSATSTINPSVPIWPCWKSKWKALPCVTHPYTVLGLYAALSISKDPQALPLDSILARPFPRCRFVLGAVLFVDVSDLGYQGVVRVWIRQHRADG